MPPSKKFEGGFFVCVGDQSLGSKRLGLLNLWEVSAKARFGKPISKKTDKIVSSFRIIMRNRN